MLFSSYLLKDQAAFQKYDQMLQMSLSLLIQFLMLLDTTQVS